MRLFRVTSTVAGTARRGAAVVRFRGRVDGCVLRIYGGAERDRTDDLLSAIQALSQLSYSPTMLESIEANGSLTDENSERRIIGTGGVEGKSGSCDTSGMRKILAVLFLAIGVSAFGQT